MPAKKGSIPWNKGKKMTNYPQCGFQKGHPPFKGCFSRGSKHTMESRRKMSNSLKGRKPPKTVFKSENMRGDKHPNWKGGITPENNEIKNSFIYREWRKKVFQRDDWTCQKCKLRQGWNKRLKRRIVIEAHHILNFGEYPELRFVVENGITLCKECHMRFHKIYGKKNNTKEQLKEFLYGN